MSAGEITGSFMSQTALIEGISLSIFDLYHDVARDFGVNLQANLKNKVISHLLNFSLGCRHSL